MSTQGHILSEFDQALANLKDNTVAIGLLAQKNLENAFAGLTLFQPFATDLRFVIASMKVTHNLERMSDHAVSIAKRARKILKGSEIDEISFIEPGFKQAMMMLKIALSSYVENDLDKALEVLKMETKLL